MTTTKALPGCAARNRRSERWRKQWQKWRWLSVKRWSGAREAAAGFRDLAETITDFDTMRYLLINRFGWTYGHASDCIELLEKMTGITLER